MKVLRRLDFQLDRRRIFHPLTYDRCSRDPKLSYQIEPFGTEWNRLFDGGAADQNGGYASSRDYRLNCSLLSADRRGRRSRSRGVQRLGRATNRRPLPARKLADDYAQFAQTCQDSAGGIVDACGPGSPDSHRVVWGLTSRPPVPPAGFPPVSRLPAGFSPLARLPLVSRRPAFSGSSPSAVCPVPVPLRCPSGFPSLEQSSR